MWSLCANEGLILSGSVRSGPGGGLWPPLQRVLCTACLPVKCGVPGLCLGVSAGGQQWAQRRGANNSPPE